MTSRVSTMVFVFFKQKTAYEMRISDWSSDVCSSDLEDFKEVDGMLTARSRVIEPAYNAKERELDVVSRTLISLFEQLVKQSRKLPPEVLRSAERRVGKECVSTCSSRCSPDH